jgi:inner membrane protein
MASPFSHAIAALSIGSCFYQPRIPKRLWLAGALCSVVPDLDVIGFRFGVRYGDFCGHRGFTHSILFAFLLAGIVALLMLRRAEAMPGPIVLFSYLFLATVSHGVLDAMTNGGLGVAFFSPFHDCRYFLPWRPILVSPISMARFFNARGSAVLLSEIRWIWVPAILFAGIVLSCRRVRRENFAPADK